MKTTHLTLQHCQALWATGLTIFTRAGTMNSSLAEIADRCYPVKSTISASDEFIVQGCKVREVVYVQIDGK